MTHLVNQPSSLVNLISTGQVFIYPHFMFGFLGFLAKDFTSISVHINAYS